MDVPSPNVNSSCIFALGEAFVAGVGRETIISVSESLPVVDVEMAAGIFDIGVRVALVIATTLLFAIIFLAYLRVKNRRMLFISAGFGVFWVHSLISLPELFDAAYALDENMHLFIPLIGLIFILLGIVKD